MVGEDREQIEVFHLPSNSPEPNPYGYLDCDLKAGVHSGSAGTSQGDRKRKSLSRLRALQIENRVTVRAYFQPPKI